MVVVAAAVYPHLLYIFVFGLLFLFAVALLLLVEIENHCCASK